MIIELWLWILSVFIWGIMNIQNCFKEIEVIPHYYDKSGDWSDKAYALLFMVALGGWIFWPYMVFLLAKYMYIKIINKK